MYEVKMARLNVTFNGENGDLQDPVEYDFSDEAIKQIATEAVRTGYIIGIKAYPDADFTDFVVDRFEAAADLPARLNVRPKTPFGQ